MKSFILAASIFVLSLTIFAAPAEAETYDSYCFEETKTQANGTSSGTTKVTYCLATPTNCRSSLNVARQQSPNSQFSDLCSNSEAAASMCQSNLQYCFDSRPPNNSGVIAQTPITTTCLATESKCLSTRAEFDNNNPDYILSSGCSNPKWRNMCLIDLDREANSGNGSGDSGSGSNSNPSNTSNQPVSYWCFNPTNTLNNETGTACFDERQKCLDSRTYCMDLASCSVDKGNLTCSMPQLTTPSTQPQSQAERLANQLMTSFSTAAPPAARSGLTFSSLEQFSNGRVNTLSTAGSGNQGGSSAPGSGNTGNNSGNSGGNSGGEGGEDSEEFIIADCAAQPDSEQCLKDPLEAECYINLSGDEVCEQNTIFSIIYKIIKGLTNILIPLSVLMIIYGGLQFIIARGNESKITNAKKVFLNIIIGVALIVGARILVEILFRIITDL